MGAKVKLRLADRLALEKWLDEKDKRHCPFPIEEGICERLCDPLFPRTGKREACPMSCANASIAYTEEYVVRKVRKLLEES